MNHSIIKQAALQQGMSTRIIAHRTGMSTSTVDAILNGTRPANLVSLVKVLDILGLEVVFSPKTPTT
jgi:transcriptional regulator with XRE-family HTH domain